MAAQLGEAFVEQFDGSPAAPQPFRPRDWAVTFADSGRAVNHRTGMDPMAAGHQADCGAPGEHNELSHPAQAWTDAVFLCRDHLMTAVNSGGYAAAWLTPPAMLDLSQAAGGEAVLRWDLSTFRSATRDWIEVYLVPPEDDLQTLNDGHSPQPRTALQLFMANPADRTDFQVYLIRDGVSQQVGGGYGLDYQSRLAAAGVAPSASRRDTFELVLSPTHVKFWMPGYNLVWADNDLPGGGLPPEARRLVPLFGHYSYNPTKDGPGTAPNTWHWDNIALSPAAPLAIVRADQDQVDGATGPGPQVLTFPAPAPAGAAVRFVGYGEGLEVSADGGASWAPAAARTRSAGPTNALDVATAYANPVPAGTTRVLVRPGPQTTGGWLVHAATLWAPGADSAPAPAPTAVPTAAPSPVTLPRPSPTAVAPSPSPSPSPSPPAAPPDPTKAPPPAVAVACSLAERVLTCVLPE